MEALPVSAFIKPTLKALRRGQATYVFHTYLSISISYLPFKFQENGINQKNKYKNTYIYIYKNILPS